MTPQDSTTGATAADQAAISRYRYLLRTAPPERIEQAPSEEVPRVDEPQAMARAATRAEMAQPGYLQNTFGRTGVGFGGMFAGSMLGTVAGVVVGSALADVMLGGFEHSPEAAEAAGAPPEATDPAAAEDGSASESAAQTDAGGDFVSDFGGDFMSDFGGDFF